MNQHNHISNLHVIHEQLIAQSIDTNHLAMALQAVKTDDLQSKGIINVVINALFNNIEMTTDMTEQITSLILNQPIEDDYHE